MRIVAVIVILGSWLGPVFGQSAPQSAAALPESGDPLAVKSSEAAAHAIEIAPGTP
jgi:hypothetical protein